MASVTGSGWTRRDDTRRLCAKAARTAGITPEKCLDVFTLVVDVIGRETARGGNVRIDGFGNFGARGPQGRFTKIPRLGFFLPAEQLLERLNQETSVDSRQTSPNGPIESPSDTPALEPAAPDMLLPVHPLRPQDLELIEGWLNTRAGDTSERQTADTLYGIPNRKPRGVWDPETIVTARKAIRAFARRCPVPMLYVGMGGEEIRPFAALPLSIRAAETVAYFNDFSARAIPRLKRLYRKAREIDDTARLQMVRRTMSWNRFVDWAGDFYAWLEAQGLRPAHSNPFTGIARLPVEDFTRGRIAINHRWYAAVLACPHPPRDRALLELLANGLRIGEAITLKVSQIDFATNRIHVLGKRRRTREYELYPWTAAAVKRYLDTRRLSLSEWVFAPDYRATLPHLGDQAAREAIRQAVRRAFPRHVDAKIRRHIHPHGFRHFFATAAIESGMNPYSLMRVLGHSNLTTVSRYVTAHQDMVDREVARTRPKVARLRQEHGKVS